MMTYGPYTIPAGVDGWCVYLAKSPILQDNGSIIILFTCIPMLFKSLITTCSVHQFHHIRLQHHINMFKKTIGVIPIG